MQSKRVVVITGSASGMGRAAALRWAAAGCTVAAVDRDAGPLKELERENPGITAFVCDVTDAEAVQRTAAEISTQLGRVDSLVNAAGICITGPVGGLPASEFRRVMEVNYFGTMHWVDAILPSMRERGSGQIVNFASVAGWIPTPNMNAYGASKFAVIGYTEGLAEETRGQGVRVLCVCPPGVATPLYDGLMEGSSLGPRIQKVMRPITAESVIDEIDKHLPGRRTFVFPGRGTKTMIVMRRFAPNVTNRLFRKVYGL